MNRFFTEYAGRVPLSPRRCIAGNRKFATAPVDRKSRSVLSFEP